MVLKLASFLWKTLILVFSNISFSSMTPILSIKYGFVVKLITVDSNPNFDRPESIIKFRDSPNESFTCKAFVDEIYPLILALGAAIGLFSFFIIAKKIFDFGILKAIELSPEVTVLHT